jgi:lipopolysaccharide export LptBFGC system permease protein LptF
MFKTLDRYILRAFFTNYVIAMAVMIGLYVVLDLFVNLDEFTAIKSDTRLQTVYKIVDYYGYNLLLYFSQLSGTILLIAGCFTFGRFLQTNELTAVLASGTSLYRVATPVLLAALLMNGLWFLDQEVLIPRFADKLARRHSDIEGRNAFAVWFQPDRDKSLVSASAFQPRVKEMRGVIIIKRDEQLRMTEVIRADRARWDEERQLWHLENGYVMPLASPSAGGAAEVGRAAVREYASELTPKELQLQQASQWTSFLSLPDLEKLNQRFAESGTGEFIKVKHRRLTTVIMNMILLCVGIPFFLNRERPSVLIVGARCLAMCAVCFVATFMCQSMNFGPLGISPALPSWIPIIVFGPVAVLLLDAIKT